ncbi:hypothetical protein ACFIQF_13040 [Comamonas sp. J-3]|uniref:hypothetical protein n=1 Tax=Comamonas trifloxystrobinivorans TaxID=3350256 RepID=UPI00372A2989
MADNNSPPPLMTDKELLMEGGAYSEIMAAAFEYADAYCSSGDEPRRYKAAIDNLRKTVRAEIARFSRGNYKAPQPQVEPASHVINDDVLNLVSLALRKAWQLGQTYWQQADSEFISQQNKSDATRAKFQALIDETRAALATTQPAATVNQQLTADRTAPAGEYPALPLAEYKSWANGGLLRNDGYTAEQMRAYADATHAMRAGEQEPVVWPKDANDVRAFFSSDFIAAQFASEDQAPCDEDRYTISAHDFLSAVNWWADFPHVPRDTSHVATSEHQKPLFYTAFGSNGMALPSYAGYSEFVVIANVLAVAKNEGFKGTGKERMKELGWTVRPVFASPVATQGEQAIRDAAFEAVRKKLCKLQRYSFHLDACGNIRRVSEFTGNWIEFDAAHALFDPVAVDAAIDAALSATTPPVATTKDDE